MIFDHSCNSLNIFWNTSILCCWVYLFLYLIQLGDIHRVCLHDYIHILSMYVFLGLFVVCKATLRDKRKFVQGIEKGVKTYSPPSRYALSNLTTFVYFQTYSSSHFSTERCSGTEEPKNSWNGMKHAIRQKSSKETLGRSCQHSRLHLEQVSN